MSLSIIDLPSGRVRTIANQPPGQCVYASWSPSKATIACALVTSDPSTRKPARENLWVVDLDREAWKQVTDFSPGDGPGYGSGLAWAPDGQAIAFVRSYYRRDSKSGVSSMHYSVCVVAKDGTGLRELTRVTHGTSVAWSPDSRWLAFSDLRRDEGNMSWPPSGEPSPEFVQISLVRPDGAGRKDDVALADLGFSFSWSPNGKQLLYQRLCTCMIGTPAVAFGQ